MRDGTSADLSVLDALAGRLRRAGDSVDSVGEKSPGVPDAGEVTAALGGVMAHLVGSAGNLVVGLWEAGDRVVRSRESYVRRDTDAAENIAELF